MILRLYFRKKDEISLLNPLKVFVLSPFKLIFLFLSDLPKSTIFLSHSLTTFLSHTLSLSLYLSRSTSLALSLSACIYICRKRKRMINTYSSSLDGFLIVFRKKNNEQIIKITSMNIFFVRFLLLRIFCLIPFIYSLFLSLSLSLSLSVFLSHTNAPIYIYIYIYI